MAQFNPNLLQYVQAPAPQSQLAPSQWPMTTMGFYDTAGNIPPSQSVSQYAPTPLSAFVQSGQQLATAGKFDMGQAPGKRFQLPETDYSMLMATLEGIPEVGPVKQDFSYFIPGQPGRKAPAVPTPADFSGLPAPVKPEEMSKADQLLQALGNLQWQEGVATGTNLFNIGAKMMQGMSAAKAQGKAEEKDYLEAMRQFAIQKMGLEKEEDQQHFENLLKAAAAERLDQPVLKPQFDDGTLMYGVREDGGQRVHVQKIRPSKTEQQMALLQAQQEWQQPNIANAVISGKVPPAVSQALLPIIGQIQQEVLMDAAASLGVMDDVTKRRYIDAQVNYRLQTDPELAPLIEKLVPQLQQQELLKSALK